MAGKVTGMMQIKQANVQSGIYIVLQTWTACETKLVRFFLRCKLKIKAGTSVDFDCFFTDILVFSVICKGGAFTAEVVAENITGKLKMLSKAQVFFLPKQN